jgi:hypothetical protein
MQLEVGTELLGFTPNRLGNEFFGIGGQSRSDVGTMKVALC